MKNNNYSLNREKKKNLIFLSNILIFHTESTNEILRVTNIGASHKDKMESFAEKSMRRYKKIYCRLDY